MNLVYYCSLTNGRRIRLYDLGTDETVLVLADWLL